MGIYHGRNSLQTLNPKPDPAAVTRPTRQSIARRDLLRSLTAILPPWRTCSSYFAVHHPPLTPAPSSLPPPPFTPPTSSSLTPESLSSARAMALQQSLNTLSPQPSSPPNPRSRPRRPCPLHLHQQRKLLHPPPRIPRPHHVIGISFFTFLWA